MACPKSWGLLQFGLHQLRLRLGLLVSRCLPRRHQRFAVARGWVLEPQLQLMHQRIELDDAHIAYATVQQSSHNGWVVRAGLRLKGEMATAVGTLQPYGRLNVYSLLCRASAATCWTVFMPETKSSL
ncbi:Autotransporter beta-domain protein [compost metagenome]